MHGKKKCKILKEIRKQIAKDNDITYVTTECKHQGNCKGTCPKCEAEVRYLEAELEKRRMAGKQVVVAGIAAAMMMSASCTPEPEDTSSNDAPSKTASEYSEMVNGRTELAMDISAHHALIDGRQLVRFYENLQTALLNPEDFLRRE
jgi:hypothetical protein